MSRKPNRYELPITSMLGAMIVVLAVIVGFVVFRALVRNNVETPVRTVDYAHLLRQGAEDGKLDMLSPRPMPSGWRATSATYRGGAAPRWHLGILTSEGKYVGLEEARGEVSSLLKDAVKGDAEADGEAKISGQTWQQWRGETGDYVLTRQVGDNAVLVRGQAAATTVQAFVARLKPYRR